MRSFWVLMSYYHTCLSASFNKFRNRSSRTTQWGKSVCPLCWASSRRCLNSLKTHISSFSCLCRVLDAWRSSSRSKDVLAISSAKDDLQDCSVIRIQIKCTIYYSQHSLLVFLQLYRPYICCTYFTHKVLSTWSLGDYLHTPEEAR